jgi:hypothetical protein
MGLIAAVEAELGKHAATAARVDVLDDARKLLATLGGLAEEAHENVHGYFSSRALKSLFRSDRAEHGATANYANAREQFRAVYEFMRNHYETHGTQPPKFIAKGGRHAYTINAYQLWGFINRKLPWESALDAAVEMRLDYIDLNYDNSCIVVRRLPGSGELDFLRVVSDDDFVVHESRGGGKFQNSLLKEVEIYSPISVPPVEAEPPFGHGKFASS